MPIKEIVNGQALNIKNFVSAENDSGGFDPASLYSREDKIEVLKKIRSNPKEKVKLYAEVSILFPNEFSPYVQPDLWNELTGKLYDPGSDGYSTYLANLKIIGQEEFQRVYIDRGKIYPLIYYFGEHIKNSKRGVIGVIANPYSNMTFTPPIIKDLLTVALLEPHMIGNLNMYDATLINHGVKNLDDCKYAILNTIEENSFNKRVVHAPRDSNFYSILAQLKIVFPERLREILPFDNEFWAEAIEMLKESKGKSVSESLKLASSLRILAAEEIIIDQNGVHLIMSSQTHGITQIPLPIERSF